MAGRKLAVNVTTPDETGRMVTFMAGDTVSAEVAKGITNPKAWGEGEDSDTEAEAKPAAKKAASSKSSSKSDN